MKTPREILLQRHESNGPQLDAIRRAVVEKIHNQATKQPGSVLVSLFLRCSQNFWRELIWPSRRIWAGIAAAWVLIVAVNLRDVRSDALARLDYTPISPAMLMALREPERWFNDFAEPQKAPEADRKKKSAPAPRSESPSQLLFA